MKSKCLIAAVIKVVAQIIVEMARVLVILLVVVVIIACNLFAEFVSLTNKEISFPCLAGFANPAKQNEGEGHT